ncbi:MAG: hypothetical protein D6771_06300 [Zetaproteobacteria bacterium]|nr:MAG: hypothetical protein D6771_06300 [Zetaproteobacteria bacterium]
MWVRRRLFPQIEALGVDPVRLFLRLGAQAARVHEALMGELARVPIRAREGKAFVDLEAWRAAPSPLRALILKALMRCVLGPGVAPGRRHIMLAERWTAQGARGGVDITRGRLMREGQTIAFGARGFMESSSTPRYRSS